MTDDLEQRAGEILWERQEYYRMDETGRCWYGVTVLVVSLLAATPHDGG